MAPKCQKSPCPVLLKLRHSDVATLLSWYQVSVENKEIFRISAERNLKNLLVVALRFAYIGLAFALLSAVD